MRSQNRVLRSSWVTTIDAVPRDFMTVLAQAEKKRGEQFAETGDDAGVFLDDLGRAILTWAAMQDRQPMTVADAAKAFNTTPAVIREASEDVPWICIEGPDDAAVYRINDHQAVVATTDFFLPIVDDPYDFGRIAAANALSDVYAMGGRPILALAIVGMPLDKLPLDVIGQILEGGASVCREAGVKLVLPPPNLCTDNGAMIAWAGIERLRLGLTNEMNFAPRARWPGPVSPER